MIERATATCEFREVDCFGGISVVDIPRDIGTSWEGTTCEAHKQVCAGNTLRLNVALDSLLVTGAC